MAKIPKRFHLDLSNPLPDLLNCLPHSSSALGWPSSNGTSRHSFSRRWTIFSVFFDEVAKDHADVFHREFEGNRLLRQFQQSFEVIFENIHFVGEFFLLESLGRILAAIACKRASTS